MAIDFQPTKKIDFQPTKPVAPSIVPSTQGLSSRIWADIVQRGANVQSAITSEGNPLVSGLKATAQGFGAIGDVIGETIKSTPLVGKLYEKVEEKIGQGFEALTGKIADTQLFKEAAESPEGLGKIEELLQALQAGGEI